MILFEKNMRVEFIEVMLTIPDHPQWTDLEVTLTSPTGPKSVLAEPHDPPDQQLLLGWKFGSVRYFGEPSAGKWKLAIKDLKKNNGKKGSRFYGKLKIYGTELPT